MIKLWLKQWNGMRLLRLGIGIAAIVQGSSSPAPLLWVIGAVLVVQAVMNIGCMGGACAVPQSKQQTKQVNKHEESL
ncbi:MAG: hypothetical protein GXC73_01600 [Chitinophagaceae bacterium]|nr:hypothetical protein [Chitinophagaceae bacterium]